MIHAERVEPAPTATPASLPADAAPPPAAPRRATALDALRGLAILTMVLSGVVPRGVLPSWMYHAQVPPPDHVFVPTLPGITWVDLVFPFFLIALGVAIPLALGRRLERGATLSEAARHTLGRGARLFAFAVLLQHVRPFALDGSPGWAAWAAALAGFALLSAAFMRLPRSWSGWQQKATRALGYGGLLALAAAWDYGEAGWLGTGFRLGRSDIILLVLANVALVGGLIWLATRERPGWRWGITAALVAFRLGASVEGSWAADVYAWTPVPEVVRWAFLTYLILVLPSTIVGDHLAKWLRASGGEARLPAWREGAIVALAPVATVWLLATLQARWLVAATLGGLAFAALAAWLVREGDGATERLLHALGHLAALGLAMGVLAEPFDGGIRKDPNTLSYFFLSFGLGCAWLSSLTLLAERFGSGLGMGAAGRVLVANGQNPMIAYVGIANLVLPVLALVGALPLVNDLTATPALALLRGIAYTVLLAVLVTWMTRRGFVWKS
jgi:hypothetical protein